MTEWDALTTNKLAVPLHEVMTVSSLWTYMTITTFLVKWTNAPFETEVRYPVPVIRGVVK